MCCGDARRKNVERWEDEERWVLWEGVVSVARMAYNRSSFMQANTLCSVIFSRQNEQIWCFRVFPWKTSMLAYNRSSLYKQTFCEVWSMVAKMSKSNVLGFFFFWKPSMFAYNRSSLLKQRHCVVWSLIAKISRYDVLRFFLERPLCLLTIATLYASKLFVWCDIGFPKWAIMMFWELSWNTSMLPYNPSSLCKQALWVMWVMWVTKRLILIFFMSFYGVLLA